MPHHYGTGGAKTSHGMILILPGLRRRRAAQPHRLPADRQIIFDRPDARKPQVPAVGPRVDLPGLPQRLRRPDPYERAQFRVNLRDPVQMLGDHAAGRDMCGYWVPADSAGAAVSEF